MAKIKTLPSGKKPVQKLQDGAKAMGPSHENGGIPVVQEDSGEQVAEIEGNERVFSREDTQMMEQMCGQIVQLSAQNKQAADQAAMQLGYAVCDMISKQEDNQNGGQPTQQPGQEDMYAGANEFANSAED